MTGATDRFARYPSLRDRVALVTGGGNGIGAAIALHLAGQGARVGVIDLDGDAAQRTLAAAPDPARLHVETADLRDIGALRGAIDAIVRALGPVTVLVNNAAHDDRHAIEAVTPEYWDERMAVNLRHQFFAAQAVLPGMTTAGGGSIVNLGSSSWMLAEGGMPAYVTAKAGVAGLTRALARDLGPRGIRVNSVIPGWIMTERQRRLWVTPEREAALLQSQCLKETLDSPDVARLVLWLAADDSRLVTSQSFVVDGGRV